MVTELLLPLRKSTLLVDHYGTVDEWKGKLIVHITILHSRDLELRFFWSAFHKPAFRADFLKTIMQTAKNIFIGFFFIVIRMSISKMMVKILVAELTRFYGNEMKDLRM